MNTIEQKKKKRGELNVPVEFRLPFARLDYFFELSLPPETESLKNLLGLRLRRRRLRRGEARCDGDFLGRRA